MLPRFALYGRPGAGKSTFAGLLAHEFELAKKRVLHLRLGEPLYELQAIVYAVARRPMVRDSDQDGELLNFLGLHLRHINPDALTAAFAQRVKRAEELHPSAVLLCDDLRAPDVDAVTRLGFRLVEIVAPEQRRLIRKKARADLFAGSERHPTEASIEAVPWRRVDNAGSVDDLRNRATELVREVTS